MADFYTSKDDSITHSAIVHELLKKIVTELAVKEFKGGYQKTTIIAGMPHTEYVPDSRSEYIQSIEALTDILIPQFDEIMNTEYKEYLEAIEDLENKIDFKDMRIGDDNHKKFTKRKMELIRTLFQRLNLLLKRTNYLKANAYSEGMEDGDED